MMDTLATLPGKKAKHRGQLMIELTDASLAHISIRHPDIDMDSSLREWWMESVRVNVGERLSIADYPLKTVPWAHQKEAIEIFGPSDFFGLYFEMGTGKTKVVLDIAGIKYIQGKIDTLLIIAPNGVHKQWILEQIPEHLMDTVPRSAAYLSGNSKSRDYTLDYTMGKKGTLKIIAVNIESTSSASGKARVRRLIKMGRTMVVYDESSGIKGFESSRTEFSYEVGRMENSVCRAILDGTPITQGAEDMYGPLEFLDPSILQCPNWYAYRARYLVMDPNNKTKVVSYKNLEDLQKRMYSHAMRVLTADCLDMPEKINVPRYVEMTPEQEKHYSDMKDLFLHEMDDGRVVDVKEALVRLGKLQQILSGFIITKHEDGVDSKGKIVYRREITSIGTGKLDALVSILQQTEQKAIVWTIFREEADLIEAHLKKNLNTGVVRYTGKEDESERESNKQQFKSDPDTQVIIASMAMCRGHNITEATLAIWCSFPSSLMQWQQANARNWRGGQTKTCTIIRLTVPGTIDERCYGRLVRKEEFQHMMLDIREAVSEGSYL